MNTDPLATARGAVFGLFLGIALWAFLFGAVAAAAGEEHTGAVCMIVACAASLVATVIGVSNANT